MTYPTTIICHTKQMYDKNRMELLMQEKALQYVPIDCRLKMNPKVREFCSLLGEQKVGHVYFVNLLLAVGIHYPTGVIGNVDAEHLAKLCDYDGDSQALLNAFRKSRLVSFARKSRHFSASIANWNEYGGRVIKERQRIRNYRESNSGVNSTGTVPEHDNKLNKSNIYTEKKPRKKITFSKGERFSSLRVYSHWLKAHPRGNRKPTDTSLSYIVKALRSGRTVEDLTRCSDGYHNDSWYKNNVACLKPNWMFKDDDRIVGGLELRDKQSPSKPKPKNLPPADVQKKYWELMTDYGAQITQEELFYFCNLGPSKDQLVNAMNSIDRQSRTGTAILEALNV